MIAMKIIETIVIRKPITAFIPDKSIPGTLFSAEKKKSYIFKNKYSKLRLAINIF